VLDEAHAPHVGGQIVDVRSALGDLFAVLFEVQIERTVFHVIEPLVPLSEGLDVNRSDPPPSLPAQRGNQRSTDEATRACDYHQTVFTQGGSSQANFFTSIL